MTPPWLRRMASLFRQSASRDRKSRRKSVGLHVEELERRVLLSAYHQRFVDQVYRDFLRRPADVVGLAGWSAALDGGLARDQLLRAVEDSLEYRTRQVEELYQTLLHRPADPVGRGYFVAVLAAAGGSRELVQTVLLSTPEYFQRRGGGTPRGFLSSTCAHFFAAADKK